MVLKKCLLCAGIFHHISLLYRPPFRANDGIGSLKGEIIQNGENSVFLYMDYLFITPMRVLTTL